MILLQTWPIEDILIVALPIIFTLILYAATKLVKGGFRSERLEIGPLYLLIKVFSLNEALKDWIEVHRRSVNLFFTIGGGVALAAMVGGIYFLADNLYRFIFVPVQAQPLVLLVPGITVRGATLIKMVPALAIVVISHELFHKLACHVYAVKVKSVGVGLLLFLPLAFVEPDEDILKKSKPLNRLRILAVGSFANLIIAGLTTPLILNPGLYYEPILSPVYGPASGMVVRQLVLNGPLYNDTDIRPGDVIVGIDNAPIKRTEDLSTLKILPNQKLTILYYKAEDVRQGTLGNPRTASIVTMPLETGRGAIGIYPVYGPGATYYPSKTPYLGPDAPAIVFDFLIWLWVISLGVAIMNMLPIYPLDGYRVLEAAVEKVGLKETRRKALLYTAMAVSLVLLISNLAASYGGLGGLWFLP